MVNHVVNRDFKIFSGESMYFYPRNPKMSLFSLSELYFRSNREKTIKSLISRCSRLWSPINFIFRFLCLVGETLLVYKIQIRWPDYFFDKIFILVRGAQRTNEKAACSNLRNWDKISRHGSLKRAWNFTGLGVKEKKKYSWEHFHFSVITSNRPNWTVRSPPG